MNECLSEGLLAGNCCMNSSTNPYGRINKLQKKFTLIASPNERERERELNTVPIFLDWQEYLNNLSQR